MGWLFVFFRSIVQLSHLASDHTLQSTPQILSHLNSTMVLYLFLCTFVTALLANPTFAVPQNPKPVISSNFNGSTIVHAADCVLNTTHCHCVESTPAPSGTCIKPIVGKHGTCYLGGCAGGYKCDCSSSDICKLVTTVYYAVESTPTTSEFSCAMGLKEVPKKKVAHTSDFDIIAYDQFELFVNNDTIGFSNSIEHLKFTAEVTSGDVIGVKGTRGAGDEYGVKLVFADSIGERRNIDGNWWATNADQGDESWLQASFDPESNGWERPVAVDGRISDPSFDKSVSYMWLGDYTTVYFRYVYL